MNTRMQRSRRRLATLALTSSLALLAPFDANAKKQAPLDEEKDEATLEPISAAETGDAGPFHPVTFGHGIMFQSPDGKLSSILRFRIQNRAGFIWRDSEPAEGSRYTHEWQVRRARVRFMGHVVDPRLRYNFQLSFARSDQDWDNAGVPNVVRDAMVLFDVTRQWQVAFGQGKLPGNRQRVISSGDLQFVDRSLLNQRFNLDRDFGFQTQYQFKAGKQSFNLKGSVTSGEGRNRNVPTDGRSFYVARAEWLPLGEFQRNGDYFEGDLAYEETPKLSLAYSHANLAGAAREGGAIGRILVSPTDPNLYFRRTHRTQFIDAVFKYRGHAVSAEWAERLAADPIIELAPGQTRSLLIGQGLNVQISKLVTESLELAGRYTKIVPFRSVRSFHPEETDMTLVATQYLSGHRTKVQGEVGYLKDREAYLRLQIELGI